MTSSTLEQTAPASPRTRLWAGWALTGLVSLFLAMDGGMKLADLAPVRQASAQLGWPLALDRPIGVIEIVGLVLFVVPRTAVLGAIVLTGLFGGAVAAHLRIASPLFSHVLFGVYLGVMMWGGLWLRDERVRALIPFRR
jgi:hypothetical protein